MVIDAVYKRLKEGSIKRVVVFGDSEKVPPPPYVVIKSEADTGNETRRIRIIAHVEQGQQRALEEYMNELTALLKRHSMKNYMERGHTEWTDVIAGNDDKTIAMERVFIFPWRLP
jgi:hypothetical protein